MLARRIDQLIAKSHAARSLPVAQTQEPPIMNKRDKLDWDFVSAPYRFAEVIDAVAPPEAVVEDALKAEPVGLHSQPLAGAFSGRITLDWVAETPLLIGEKRRQEGSNDDCDGPLRIGEDWWFPGSSFRGMVRSAAEIVGCARLSQSNRHHIFPLRDFQHPRYNGKDEGGYPVSKADHVSAGWLFREGTDKNNYSYKIQPCGDDAVFGGERGFRYIEIENILKSTALDRDYYNKQENNWVNLSRDMKYISFKMFNKKYIIKEKKDVVLVNPYKPMIFDVENVDEFGRKIVNIPKHKGAETIQGTFVFSDRAPSGEDGSNPKKYEYVFVKKPDKSDAGTVAIHADAFARFELVNTAPGRTKAREPIGAWEQAQKQLDAGYPVPVFYVGSLKCQDKQFMFGLTRTFRVPHRFSVGEVIDKQRAHKLQRQDANRYEPDMVEALFGYVHEPRDYEGGDGTSVPSDALKGRVAFSGAVIPRNEAHETSVINTIMGAPRASFSPFYLSGEIKDWSDDTARIAGRKLYPARPVAGNSARALEVVRARLERQLDPVRRQSRDGKVSSKIQSHLTFLCGGKQPSPEPLTFQTNIDVHNVTLAELGLLLFALTHGGDADGKYRHMFGRAKPFGAGQLKLAQVKLDKVSPNGGGEPPTQGAAIEAFQAHMRRAADRAMGADAAQLRNYPDIGPVRDYLAASDPANWGGLHGPGARRGNIGKDENLWQDNYLALNYFEVNNGGETVKKCDEDKKSSNPKRYKNAKPPPYSHLRKATMMLDQTEPPQTPNRLLPASKPPER